MRVVLELASNGQQVTYTHEGFLDDTPPEMTAWLMASEEVAKQTVPPNMMSTFKAGQLLGYWKIISAKGTKQVEGRVY